MFNIAIIGAGQLGSRHLQALKNVREKLYIYVLDPSQVSLQTAQERYDAFMGYGNNQRVVYTKNISELPAKIDLGVVATNSDSRFEAVSKLMQNSEVKYLLIKKLLFNKKEHYSIAEKIFSEKNVKVWVNCSMRAMKFYSEIYEKLHGEMFNYRVTGSNYGLITNSIHYIDHIAYLSGSDNFTVDTRLLLKEAIDSKRRGFLELNGKLIVEFDNGCLGEFISYKGGNAPLVVEIFSENFRCISRETEGKSFISSLSTNWNWLENNSRIPYQSEKTTELVNEILDRGTCPLVEYRASKIHHLSLLESLNKFLKQNKISKDANYPFT